MANPYYETTYTFTARTRAIGSQVKFEVDSVEDGFDAIHASLPALVGDGTGFTVAVVVDDATLDTHAITYAQLKTWPAEVSANSFKLTTLADGTANGDAVNLGQMNTAIAATEWLNLAYTGISASESARVNSAGNAIEAFTPMESGVDDLLGIRTETGTTWTAAIDDHGKHIESNNASATTVTIPTNASVAIPIGSCFCVEQVGAGKVSYTTTSLTIRTKDSAAATIAHSEQGAVVAWTKVATDTWVVTGDMELA